MNARLGRIEGRESDLPCAQPIRLIESRRNTTNERSCDAAGIRTSANPSALASALDLLRENDDRYEVLLARYPFQHRWQERRYIQVERGTDLDDSALVVDTVVYDSRARHGYRIGSPLYQVRSEGRETELTIFLPTPRDFTDSLFQREHCFTYRGTSHHEIRIDFRPAHRITVPDVAGSIYLDQARYVVRRAVFELTHPEAMDPPIERFTVQATFDEIVPLVPVLTSLHGEQRLATAWRFEGAAGGEGVERTAIDDKRMTYFTLRNQILHELRASTMGEPNGDRVAAIRDYGMPTVADPTWDHVAKQGPDTHATVEPFPTSDITSRGGNTSYVCQ